MRVCLLLLAVLLTATCDDRHAPPNPENGKADRVYAAAWQLATAGLLSPASAKLVSQSVVTRRGDVFFVHLVLDAQNGFGVPIRQGYCVVLHIDDPAPGRFTHNDKAGVQECSREVNPDEVAMVMSLNGWGK